MSLFNENIIHGTVGTKDTKKNSSDEKKYR